MTNNVCERIRALLSATLSRELTPEERGEVERHCDRCPACAEAFRAIDATRGLLREHRPINDAPPDEFRAALHRRLVEEAQTRPRTEGPRIDWRWRTLLGVLGCAFLFLLGYLAFTALPETGEEGVIVSRSIVNAKEPLTVRVTYTAERPLAGVRVTVRLDDGVAFYTDDPGLRALREYVWTGDLRAGANEIPFVVEVRRLGEHRISTTAEFEGYRHRHDVALQADDETIAVTYLDYRKRPL